MKKISNFVLFLAVNFSIFISLETFARAPEKQNEELQIKNYVEGILNSSFDILNDSKIDEALKISKVKKMLSSNLDTKWMGRFALGRSKVGLSEDKLAKFDDVYARYIVKYYSNGVKLYNGQKVQIISFSKKDNAEEFFVKTSINQNNGDKINVNYMVRSVDGGSFKIFDVIAENVSLLSSQRSEFGAFLQNKTIDELVSLLESKI